MKKMTRNEFLKMGWNECCAGRNQHCLVPTAIAAEPIGTVLSAKKSVNTGTAVSSATFELCSNFSPNFLGRFWFMHTRLSV